MLHILNPTSQNGDRDLSIHCSTIGDINPNWFDSLDVGNECCVIAKSVAKKSVIVTSGIIYNVSKSQHYPCMLILIFLVLITKKKLYIMDIDNDYQFFLEMSTVI